MKPSAQERCQLVIIPPSLLTPCPIPKVNIMRWRDYPDYVVILHEALNACNTDKEAISLILKKFARDADSDFLQSK
ncbi:Rz1-like lysis system protein LysC [Serratia proteamaculans]|uniref:Rz1-like lysis system protein LysC n=1 Tax=Serratia proteamaculans TaxID=28151 RepID=UPI003D650229